MSLSAEALGKLEGLDLQRVRADLDFAPTVESRRPVLADLSADGMREFRNWDFSGVLAGLNSLTFEAVHPELVAAPVETAAPAPAAQEDLPDWLKSTEEAAPPVEAEEVFEPASLPEEPDSSGPTAEEAMAGLRAAEAAGAGTQVIDDGEVRIPPAGEPEEEEVEEKAKNRLVDWLKAVDWKRVALEGTTIIPPMVFGGLLGYLDPETARNISLATGTAGIGLAFTSMAAVMAERILPVHTRAGLLGRALVAAKVVGLYGGNVLLSTAIGTHVGAGIREGIEVLHASQPVSAGGGEGFNNPHPEPRPVDASAEQPPVVLSPQADDFVNRAGEVAAQEAREMADAAQGAAEMAARQAALDAATRIVQVQPGNTLTGLIDAAGGNAYGPDFTNTVLQSANILTGPQNPNRDMAKALIDFIRANPDGVNWRDAINGVGDLARQTVGGLPLKNAIAQATRMIYPGQEMKVVVGAVMP